MRRYAKKHFLTWRIVPIVLVAIAVKCAFIYAGVDLLPLNGYFSTIVAANVFLLGFLISGVLPDYKEAEKLPAEIAAALDSVIDECRALAAGDGAKAAKACIAHTADVSDILVRWFHEEERTHPVMKTLSAYAELFRDLEPYTQANFIVRMKQEVASVRRMVLRIRNIRHVPFASPAYAIAEAFSAIVIGSVIVVDTGGLLSSLLITGAITYVLAYMIALINDLDNPFHYRNNPHLADEIAIEPLGIIRSNADEALGKKVRRSRNA